MDWQRIDRSVAASITSLLDRLSIRTEIKRVIGNDESHLVITTELYLSETRDGPEEMISTSETSIEEIY